MTIHYEIEYQTPQDECAVLEVELFGDVTLEDDSYDDEFGTVKIDPYPVLEEIKYDKSEFSKQENAIIEKHLTENFKSIEAKFISKYKKETAYD